MKKQIFLLSLSLLFVGQFVMADDCCKTETKCCTKPKKTSCDKPCAGDHGKTFRRNDSIFGHGTPMYVSQFQSNVIHNLEEDDQKGGFQALVFGGQNTKRAESASYYMPYNHFTYNVTGEVTPQQFGKALAWSTMGVDVAPGAAGTITLADLGTNGATQADYATCPIINPEYGNADTADKGLFISDPVTLHFDANKDTSVLRPWNFGITYAALFQPGSPAGTAGSVTLPNGATNQGILGEGLIAQPEFKSTISPTHRYSHVGAGFALRYHFSDDHKGWFGSLSTSVENVKSHICLNEDVQTAKTDILDLSEQDCGESCPGVASPGKSNCAFGDLYVPGAIASNPAITTVKPVGAVRGAYENTGFPTGDTAPENMEQAFLQDAWNYGKMGCEQSITRLADIELTLGYQWLCSDCASANWYVGVVIPTGNKPCAEFAAPAVVGNGQHGGIMTGSMIELQLSENEDRACYYRVDTNARYLFRNTQKRSFDLKGNEWSRYMMVWENYDAWLAAQDTIVDPNSEEFLTKSKSFTPGINVFTHDMKVKPRFLGRLNQAVYFVSECFRAEMGWNVFARTKECVEFSCPWDKKPAFASANYNFSGGLSNARTIYNDATLSEVAPAIQPVGILDVQDGNVINLNSDAGGQAGIDPVGTYNRFAITEDDVDLDSAASPAVLIHTPYLTLGYAWDSECKPAVSVGASYEFSAGDNRALSQWAVWGKFELAF